MCAVRARGALAAEQQPVVAPDGQGGEAGEREVQEHEEQRAEPVLLHVYNTINMRVYSVTREKG